MSKPRNMSSLKIEIIKCGIKKYVANELTKRVGLPRNEDNFSARKWAAHLRPQ
jgi:hypothetical protein